MGIRKLLAFFRLEFRESVEFKLELAFFWVDTVFLLGVILLFWKTVAEISPASGIAGMDANQFLSLILVTRLVFLPMQDTNTVAQMVSQPVVTGRMAPLLCRPVHPLWAWLARDFFRKLRLGLLSVVILLLLEDPIRLLFGIPASVGHSTNWPMFAASLVMGYLLHYAVFAGVGLFSFWIGEVWSILFILDIISTFFAGKLFPLDVHPWIDGLSRLMPFRYFGYSPAAIYLGRAGAAELLAQAGMLLACFVLISVQWKFSMRRFEAAGG